MAALHSHRQSTRNCGSGYTTVHGDRVGKFHNRALRHPGFLGIAAKLENA